MRAGSALAAGGLCLFFPGHEVLVVVVEYVGPL